MTEIRKDPFTGQWIVTGTEGEQDFFTSLALQEKTEWKVCPFCPGSEKVSGKEIYALRTPGTPADSPGWEVRVIVSKQAALQIESDPDRRPEGMYDLMNNVGAHEVIIETPDHIKNLSNLSVDQVTKVLSTYQARMRDLEGDRRFKYSLVFKNQRKASKYRLGHSHSQLVALPITPKSIKDELQNSREYYSYKERCLYCDVITQELKDPKRIVEENDYFVAITPFASRFPFEVWVLPKRHNCDYLRESYDSINNLAKILKGSLLRIEKVLDDPPLNYMLHTAPYLREREGYWGTIRDDYHWHIEITPQILELTGFEWGTGSYIEPLLPETAAQILRDVKL